MMAQPDSAFYYVFKMIIGYEQGRNISNVLQKLNKLYTDISDEEKSLLSKSISSNVSTLSRAIVSKSIIAVRILLEIYRACDIIKLYSYMRVLETIIP